MRLNVFVAGPYIDLERDLKSYNDKEKFPRLRHHIFDQISGLGHQIYLGEHAQLLAALSLKYGAQHDAHIAEFDIACEKSDAVVIIPSSPGSFAEFGTWAHSETISKKMMVIIDKNYENDESYINLGPVKLAQASGATILYHDIEDLIGITKHVTDFVRLYANKKAVREIKNKG